MRETEKIIAPETSTGNSTGGTNSEADTEKTAEKDFATITNPNTDIKANFNTGTGNSTVRSNSETGTGDSTEEETTEKENSKTSLYEITDLDVSSITSNVKVNDMFEEHFSALKNRNEQDLRVTLGEDSINKALEIVGEAALVAKLEVELIRHLAESKYQNKGEVLKNFRDSDIYQKYYGDDGLAQRAQKFIGDRTHGAQSFIERIIPKGLSDKKDFDTSLSEMNNIFGAIQDWKSTAAPEGRLALHSVKDTAVDQLILSTITTDPKTLGLFMAMVEDRSTENPKGNKLEFDLKKSGKWADRASLGLVILGLAFTCACIIATSVFAAPAVMTALGVAGTTTGSVLTGIMGFAAGFFAEKIKGRVFNNQAVSLHKAHPDQEKDPLGKEVASVFNKNTAVMGGEGGHDIAKLLEELKPLDLSGVFDTLVLQITVTKGKTVERTVNQHKLRI